ncbi:MAG: putative glycosyltransferase EpsH [Candidatus Latescibacteria bacterium ADurb.Bin168]|nr:MAG: putative glycosyltransferase EpsH [Candidatus Latescibacteria bacterium ADurb.Bin168]
MVFIVIPVYNRKHYLRDCLLSLSKQTFPDFRVIVVDDGSTDSTLDVLAGYVEKDARFRLFQRPGDRIKGPSACRNYGFEYSQGEFIQFFDSDDLMHPRHLEMKVAVLADTIRFDFVVCQTASFVAKNKIIGRPANLRSNTVFEDSFLGKVEFLTSTPMWRRRCLADLDHLFDEGLVLGDETEFHARVLFRFRNYGVVEEPLILRREHNLSTTGRLRGRDERVLLSSLHSRRKIHATVVSNSAMTPRLLDHFRLSAFAHFVRGINAGSAEVAEDAYGFAREVGPQKSGRRVYLSFYKAVAAVNALAGRRSAFAFGGTIYLLTTRFLGAYRSLRKLLARSSSR